MENSPDTKNTSSLRGKECPASPQRKPRTTCVLSSLLENEFEETDKISHKDFFDNVKHVHLIKLIKLFVFIRNQDSGASVFPVQIFENFDYKSLLHQSCYSIPINIYIYIYRG